MTSKVILALLITLLLSAVLVPVTCWITAELHERSHWLVAGVWTSKLKISRGRIGVATSVIYDNPSELPLYGVRLSGIAPMLLLLPLAVAIYLGIDGPEYMRVLVSLPFAAGGAILSPSDILAVSFPQRFQDYASNHDESKHIEMVRIIAEELRERT